VILDRLTDHLPGLIATLVLSILGLWLTNVLATKVTLARVEEFSRRQVRLETLRGILVSTLRVFIVIAAFISVLSEFGVNVTTLLAGVSILGLAVSFGAQSLVKDVITGFFILLEDQYGVGDVVRVNGKDGLSGGVEAVSLRTTVLRDLEGTAHVIPNGEIRTVSVLSKDWARAVSDVEIAQDVNLEIALELISKTATEFFNDPAWKDKFLEPPEVLGVQALTGVSVTLRTLFKVQPKEQWGVSREFKRRIKTAFDLAGLRGPMPQMTLNMPASPASLIGVKPSDASSTSSAVESVSTAESEANR
jgi:moderate conductance mechanosensitive channel